MRKLTLHTLGMWLLATALLTAGQKAPAVKIRPAGPPLKLSSTRPKPREADPKALEVVAAYLKALGGAEALKTIEDRYEKFVVTRHTTTGQTVAIFQRYHKKPHMIREDWDISSQEIDGQPLQVTQLYNGKTGKGWTKIMGYVAPLEGKMIYTLTWDKYLDDFFVHWKQDGYALKYRSADGEVDKEPCHVIDVYPPQQQQPWRFFFSKKNHLLLKKQWRENSREGPIRKEVFYSEYRKVPNAKAGTPVLFSFKREEYTEGNLVIEREFTEVKLNSGLSDALFARPEGPLFKGRITKGEKGKTKKKKKELLPPWKRKKRVLPKAVKTVPKKETGTKAKPEKQKATEGEAKK